MHVVFAGNSQNSIDFASTFFDQNSIIKRVRNSILYSKLQVILTLLETNNQNARAVSLPPGCLCYVLCIYIYTLHYDYVIMSCYVMLCYILCIPTSYFLQGSKIGHKLMEKSEKPCQ